MPVSVMPAGVMPAGVMPAGVMPAGVMPVGVMPVGVMPVGVMSDAAPPPALADQGFAWVGVERRPQDGATHAAGQIFVQWQVPQARRHPWPLVLVHGGGGQGLDWLGTPDGRPGWASLFLRRGHAVYVVDRPGCGRSPPHAVAPGPASAPPGYEMLRARFAAPAPEQYPQARLHTQWPPGEAVLDQFVAGQEPMAADLAQQHAAEARAAAALLDRIGPAVLVTHSAGAPFGWLAAEARPDLVRAIVAVEPLGPPFATLPSGALRWGLTAAPLRYEPPAETPEALRPTRNAAPAAGLLDCLWQAEPARRLPHLSRCPIVVVTAEASWKAREDHGVVDYLRQAGARVEQLRLAAHGVRGNGHLMMLERNSDAVAAVVAGWIEAVG